MSRLPRGTGCQAATYSLVLTHDTATSQRPGSTVSTFHLARRAAWDVTTSPWSSVATQNVVVAHETAKGGWCRRYR